MASPGSHGAVAPARKHKHLRVLLPFTSDSLRIPDELAREIGSEDALIIVPCGRGVIQRVELGRDGGGAFLGRGWPELRVRAASAPGGSFSSGTTAAACSPSRHSTPPAASGS
ncbi:unnamed protein product [Urochloa humidicola]